MRQGGREVILPQFNGNGPVRWIWIDKFVEFESGRRAVAVKNVTLAEEHLHDHFPGFPVMPECLIIEAMAQTAGILVGQARDFQEKVVLAKISKVVFSDFVRPGDSIWIEAEIGAISPEAASTRGRITRDGEQIAEIDLMFSHIDQNLAGKEFPEENFVFTGTFASLLRDIVIDTAPSEAPSTESN
ncbi:MAG: 3-hydroxyacyl-ACP dehydratase FabZ family protein [Planctomycetota bacterium]|jgi:3-hydroxyacyl-[acyl-carrier-protein] dehydratase